VIQGDNVGRAPCPFSVSVLVDVTQRTFSAGSASADLYVCLVCYCAGLCRYLLWVRVYPAVHERPVMTAPQFVGMQFANVATVPPAHAAASGHPCFDRR
jgi:hypothetical protein